jgi:hypothetical protein
VNTNSTQKSFWNSFAENTWEKKSLLVKNFKSSIIEIGHKDIFLMLVDYSNQCRKIKSSDGFKLYIDGQMLHPTEVIQFLPVKSDLSLNGYHHRMENIFSDYCLVCDELLQTSQKNWPKLQEFTSILFSAVGFPNRFVEMGLYLGNYRKTPFGVHVDGCGVFSFPVVGRKTFRLWKPRFAEKNPTLDRAQNYNRFKKNSITIKAAVGDMAYWPSSAWHIAESDGTFNATWSLGVWVDRTHLDNVQQALNPLLKNKHGFSGDHTVIKDIPESKAAEISSLPENYIESIHQIKNITEDELSNIFMAEWLKHLSMQGFKTANRGDLPLKISFSSRIQLPNKKLIFWSNVKSNKSKTTTLYAFNGVVVEAPESKNFRKLIAALNTGQSCILSEYLTGLRKSQELKMFQELILPK